MRAGNIIPLAGVLAGLQINHFGVIPKGCTGKWRLTTDLSTFPEGMGVNDSIDPQYCSLEYVSVDEVALAAAGLGKGSLLAKIDIRDAYRLVPAGTNHLAGVLQEPYQGLQLLPRACFPPMPIHYHHEIIQVVPHPMDPIPPQAPL